MTKKVALNTPLMTNGKRYGRDSACEPKKIEITKTLLKRAESPASLARVVGRFFMQNSIT
jgi:hypothetical protein